MESEQLLSNRLDGISDYHGCDNAGWKQFVLDHKKHIKTTMCAVKRYTAEELVPYRYRPEEFYAEHNGDIGLGWIFMLVNDIRNYNQFTETCTRLFMPNKSDLLELQNIYDASVSDTSDTSSETTS